MDTPVKNSTDEKDQALAWKIEITNGLSFGFQAAIGFWFFTIVIGIILLFIFGVAGVEISQSIV